MSDGKVPAVMLERAVEAGSRPEKGAQIDSITLEIYWSRAIAIANEMMETLIQISFSTVIRVNRDCSAAIFDEQGRMLAQPTHSAPGHIGCMPGVMKRILHDFPVESIQPGDAFITNDPWIGAGHSPDIYIASPVFYRGHLAGFAVTVAHHIDIGGRAGPTDSQDVFEEGLLIPLMRLYSAGERNEDLFKVLQANVRLPRIVFGDLDAQLSANRLGASRLVEFGEDYGLERFTDVALAVAAATESGMRAAIRRVPDGHYRVRQELELHDEKDQPITINLDIHIQGDEATFDYEGTSAQVRRPVNCVLNYAMSYSVLGLKMMLAPELAYNEGIQRPITVKAPEGTVLNPRRPAPVWRRAVLGMQIPEIVFQALASAMPDKIIANSGSTPMWLWLYSGLRPGGKQFVFQTHFMGGLGARYGKDGLPTAAFPYNMTDTPIEILENGCPVVVHRRELSVDSGGAGRYRGGLGQEISLSPCPATLGYIQGPLKVSFSAGHLRFGPKGFGGGHAAPPAQVSVSGKAVSDSLMTLNLHEGDKLIMRLPGGGGYHSPFERDPQAVWRDVIDGFVSEAAAKAVYGVALLDGGDRVDLQGTEALRRRAGQD